MKTSTPTNGPKRPLSNDHKPINNNQRVAVGTPVSANSVQKPKSRTKKATKWALLSIGSIVILLLLAVLIVWEIAYSDIYDPLKFIKRPESYVMPDLPAGIVENPDGTYNYGDEISTDGAVLDTPVYIVEPIDKNILNILLIGQDSGRSDSMIMLSYNKNTGKIGLTSFLRDSFVPIQGHDWSKLNHSFAWGGPGLTINTINEVYQLDIQYYISVDFSGFSDIVDSIGGVPLEITKGEADILNGIVSKKLSPGEVILEGDAALNYARIRKIGDDFGRTERQRKLITSVMNKATSMGLSTVINLIKDDLKYVKTNMKSGDILSLATDFMKMDSYSVDAAAVPADGTYTCPMYKGMSIVKLDIDKNIEIIKERIYGSK